MLPKLILANKPEQFGTAQISLDILPTALDAIGVEPPAETPLDGKSLLPLLTGQSKTHHETLYWSKGGDGEWAVRCGDWKLRALKGQMELFNLAEDPAETTSLADKKPEMVKTLRGAFDSWIAQMAEPITGGSKRWKAEPAKEELTERERARRKRRVERRKQREAKKKAKCTRLPST